MSDLYDMHYEQERAIKPSLKTVIKEKIEYAALCLATSPFNRSRQIRKVRKQIRTVEVEDTKTLKGIQSTIDRFDLLDPRYGKTLDEESNKTFQFKLCKNKGLSSTKTAAPKEVTKG